MTEKEVVVNPLREATKQAKELLRPLRSAAHPASAGSADLLEALRKYGQHRDGCPKSPKVLWTSRTECTCDLDAALASASTPEKDANDLAQRMYQLGRRDGRRELQAELRTLLGLDEVLDAIRYESEAR